MCGRFGLANPHRLKAAGVLDAVLPDAVSEDAAALLEPRFNVAPTQPVVAARTRVRDGAPERRIDVLRWGLIPSWARDATIGNSLANARAETLADKPSFRGAWKAGRRCLIFADAFYEWRDVGDAEDDPRNGDAPGTPPSEPPSEHAPTGSGRANTRRRGDEGGGARGRRVARAPKPAKQPYAIRLDGDAPFAFGGLWEVWRDRGASPGGDADAADTGTVWVPTCTIITTAPNRLMARLHDRMPVIVPREHYARWLNPETPLGEAQALLAPYAPDDPGAMRAYEISRWVNDPRHDDPHVLDPLDPAPPVAESA